MGFYEEMRGVADSLLGTSSQFSATVTVTRPERVERINGVEQTIPATTFEISGVLAEYNITERADTRIESGDQKFICTASRQMMKGDLIEINGVKYRVINPGPIQPAGVRLAYKLQVRG